MGFLAFAVKFKRELIVAALVLAVAGWLYHKGRASGKQDANESNVVQSDSLLQSRLEAALNDARSAEEREQRALRLLGDAQRTIERTVVRYAEIQNERAVALQKVETLPDSQLSADVRQKLGQVDPVDPAPFTYGELRAINKAVTDYPRCEDALGELLKKAEAMDQKVEALSSQVEALNEKQQAIARIADAYHEAYVVAYNAIPKRGNMALRVVTFNLFGRPKKLGVPKPEELLQRRVNVGKAPSP